jgi:hypothetical protein
MAGVAFAGEGEGVGFATESYAASALYTTLASLSDALWRIRRVKCQGIAATEIDAATVATDRVQRCHAHANSTRCLRNWVQLSFYQRFSRYPSGKEPFFDKMPAQKPSTKRQNNRKHDD